MNSYKLLWDGLVMLFTNRLASHDLCIGQMVEKHMQVQNRSLEEHQRVSGQELLHLPQKQCLVPRSTYIWPTYCQDLDLSVVHTHLHMRSPGTRRTVDTGFVLLWWWFCFVLLCFLPFSTKCGRILFFSFFFREKEKSPVARLSMQCPTHW